MKIAEAWPCGDEERAVKTFGLCGSKHGLRTRTRTRLEFGGATCAATNGAGHIRRLLERKHPVRLGPVTGCRGGRLGARPSGRADRASPAPTSNAPAKR